MKLFSTLCVISVIIYFLLDLENKHEQTKSMDRQEKANVNSAAFVRSLGFTVSSSICDYGIYPTDHCSVLSQDADSMFKIQHVECDSDSHCKLVK